jgi:hypothetical protein
MCIDMSPARIFVDFNEMVESNLVLLSKTDVKVNSDGIDITLFSGMPVYIYMDDTDVSGKKDNLLADGVVELNNPSVNGDWTKAAKWCCRINNRGIFYESEKYT